MNDINCPYHSLAGAQPVCQIVSDIAERPVSECYVNDSACRACLALTSPPQTPNSVIASMVIGVGVRSDDSLLDQRLSGFMQSYLEPRATAPNTICVLRGLESRKVSCKPCQASSLIPVMLPVYRCPKHLECTLFNTGTFPKIQACTTCPDRLEQYVQLDAKLLPAAVIAAIPRHSQL